MKEVIVFFISGKEYGIEISHVRSLENYREVVPLPDAPDWILGTVSIRNEQFPVVDIKSWFMLPAAEVTENTKILLLRNSYGTIACVVDNVGKVFRADGENIQDFPNVARSGETAYIDFIARRNNELIVVIDPDALLTEEQTECLQKIDFSGGAQDKGK